jgi:hypothetical protein
MRVRPAVRRLAALVGAGCVALLAHPGTGSAVTSPPVAAPYQPLEPIAAALTNSDPGGRLASAIAAQVQSAAVSIDATRPTQNPTGQVPAQAPNTPETTPMSRFAATLTTTALAANTLACGQQAPMLVLCPAGASGAAPAGSYDLVGMVLTGPVPVADQTHFFQYTIDFDQDGQPATKFKAQPLTPFNFFTGAGYALAVAKQPNQPWTLNALDIRNNQSTPLPSHATVVISQNVVAALVPTSEFAVSAPAYKVTAIEHTGRFGEGNTPWSAFTDPPFGAPLAAFGTTTLSLSVPTTPAKPATPSPGGASTASSSSSGSGFPWLPVGAGLVVALGAAAAVTAVVRKRNQTDGAPSIVGDLSTIDFPDAREKVPIVVLPRDDGCDELRRLCERARREARGLWEVAETAWQQAEAADAAVQQSRDALAQREAHVAAMEHGVEANADALAALGPNPTRGSRAWELSLEYQTKLEQAVRWLAEAEEAVDAAEAEITRCEGLYEEALARWADIVAKALAADEAADEACQAAQDCADAAAERDEPVEDEPAPFLTGLHTASADHPWIENYPLLNMIWLAPHEYYKDFTSGDALHRWTTYLEHLPGGVVKAGKNFVVSLPQIYDALKNMDKEKLKGLGPAALQSFRNDLEALRLAALADDHGDAFAKLIADKAGDQIFQAILFKVAETAKLKLIKKSKTKPKLGVAGKAAGAGSAARPVINLAEAPARPSGWVPKNVVATTLTPADSPRLVLNAVGANLSAARLQYLSRQVRYQVLKPETYAKVVKTLTGSTTQAEHSFGIHIVGDVAAGRAERIIVKAGTTAVPGAVHEWLHAFANPAFNTLFPKAFKEGVTQMFTLRIALKNQIYAGLESGYATVASANNVVAVSQRMANLIGTERFAALWFSEGKEVVKDLAVAVDKAVGKRGTFHRVVLALNERPPNVEAAIKLLSQVPVKP